MSDTITVRPDGFVGEYSARPSPHSPAWYFELDPMTRFNLDLAAARALRDLLDQVIEQMEGQ